MREEKVTVESGNIGPASNGRTEEWRNVKRLEEIKEIKEWRKMNRIKESERNEGKRKV